jgi:hypothetical protein
MSTTTWLAGWFEARGSIIARTGTVFARGKQRRMDGFGVATNGPDTLIDALIATFGGARQGKRGWRCSAAGAAQFIATILPHVRHRREEFEAALDFYRFMRAHPRTGSKRGVPEHITAERDRLAKRVADLRDARRDYAANRRRHKMIRESCGNRAEVVEA